MITLYHGKTSVCSAKVRLGLAERGVGWQGRIVNLAGGEQNEDWYLALNPKAVVPALVHDGVTLLESNVILEYVDGLGDGPPLMPTDLLDQARARLWLADCLDIHAAVNTLTYVVSKRRQILAKKTPDQIAASIARMANPANASKRRDILEHGIASSHVDAALFTLRLTFGRMQQALTQGPWLLGQTYSLADTAVLAFVDRLDRLGLDQLWSHDHPAVADWLLKSRQRPSYSTAIESFAGAPDLERQNSLSAGHWGVLAPAIGRG